MKLTKCPIHGTKYKKTCMRCQDCKDQDRGREIMQDRGDDSGRYEEEHEEE